MCLKCGALYPLYINQGSIGNKQQSCFFSRLFLAVLHMYTNLFGFTSADLSPILHLSTSGDVEAMGHMTQVTILFEASWRITKPLLKDNKILNLKCKSHHIMEASVMLVQYL